MFEALSLSGVRRTVHALYGGVCKDVFTENELYPDILFAKLGQKFLLVAVIVKRSAACTMAAARTFDTAVRNKHL